MDKSSLIAYVKKISLSLLDQLLPPRCLSCGSAVQDAGRLCPDCWKDLTFLQGPACHCCGYPFDFDLKNGQSLCAACQAKPPTYDRARAALRYDDGSRGMIIAYKHNDRTDYAEFFGSLLVQASGSLDLPQDLAQNLKKPIVVPVPLYKKRLHHRRYNQSDLIGRIFAAKKSLDYIPDLLIRDKHTDPQAGNYMNRKRNVAGVFKLRDHHRGLIKGRKIILIDDVYTTGATVRSCAGLLKRAGVGSVDILTVARVCQARKI